VAVEAAVSDNVHGNRVGIEFLEFQSTERERLQLFVRGHVLGRKTSLKKHDNRRNWWRIDGLHDIER